jgi:hypothetical protein
VNSHSLTSGISHAQEFLFAQSYHLNFKFPKSLALVEAVEKLARGAVKKAEGRVLPALPSLWSFAAGLPKALPQRARHSALTDWTVQVVPTLP